MGNLTCKYSEKLFTTPVRPKSSNYENMTIEILNDDCLLQIFQLLSIADKIKIERVSKRWKFLSQISWSTFKALDFYPTTWGQTLHEIYSMQKPLLEKLLTLSGKYIISVNFHLLDYKNSGKYLKSEAVIDILKNCPNMRELLILNAEPMDRPNWEIIMELLISISHNIRKFGLRINSTNYTDEDLGKLFAKMVNLKHISLDRISESFQGTCLLSLPSGIEEINFQQISSSFENVENLKLMIGKAENLRTLGFSGTKDLNFDFLLDVLKLKANSLTKLIIRYSTWVPHNSNLLFSTMSELVNLETLDVKWSSFVDDNFLAVVANNCKKLKDLRIENCNYVTDIGITRISKLKTLNCLIMSNLFYIVSPELKNLENLKIFDCSFAKRLSEDSIISLIHTANELEILNVSGCRKVSNRLAKEIFIAVKRRKYFKTLNILIKGTKINDKKLNKHHVASRLTIVETFTFF